METVDDDVLAALAVPYRDDGLRVPVILDRQVQQPHLVPGYAVGVVVVGYNVI